MYDDSQDPIYAHANPELVAVRELPSYCARDCRLFSERSVSSLSTAVMDTSSELDESSCHVVLDLEGHEMELRRGELGGSSTSLDRPLTADQEKQLMGLRKVVERVASVVPAATRQSLKVKKSLLPTSTDFTASWEDMKRHLRDLNKDTDPLTLKKNSKPFYQRTWFACSVYALVLSLIIAGIIAIAVDRAVLMPNRVLRGEILPASSSHDVQNVPSSTQAPLAQDPTNIASILQFLDGDSNVRSSTQVPQEPTTSAAQRTTTQASVPQLSSFAFILSQPGPLQLKQNSPL